MTYLALYQNILVWDDESSAAIAGSHIEKYFHIFPLWPEWEVPQLGGEKRLIEFSIRKCLLGDYILSLRDLLWPQKWSTLQCQWVTCPAHTYFPQIWTKSITHMVRADQPSAQHKILPSFLSLVKDLEVETSQNYYSSSIWPIYLEKKFKKMKKQLRIWRNNVFSEHR